MPLSFKCDKCGNYFPNIYSTDNSFTSYVCKNDLSPQRIIQLHQYDLESEQYKRRQKRQEIARTKLDFTKSKTKSPPKPKSWRYQHPTKGGD